MARIHFLNVEEGDCSIIQHDNGYVTMIDVCSAKEPLEERTKAQQTFSDTSESLKIPMGNFHQKYFPENPVTYLQKLGVTTIFRYIQTHPDMDHMDGLQYIDANFKIIYFWDTPNTKELDVEKCTKYDEKDWKCYQKLRKSTDSPLSLNYYDGSKAKYFAIDDNSRKQDDFFQILAPTKQLVSIANKSGDWNNSSYVLLYHIHGFKVLFCGDAGNDTWNHIMSNHANDIKDIDVMIAPHHGRRGTLDFSFLNVSRPQVTLIGNALSKYLDYDQWNNRNLLHFTNNQAGNVVIDFVKNVMKIYCSNKQFATEFAMKNHQHIMQSQLGNWSLIYFTK